MIQGFEICQWKIFVTGQKEEFRAKIGFWKKQILIIEMLQKQNATFLH